VEPLGSQVRTGERNGEEAGFEEIADDEWRSATPLLLTGPLRWADSSSFLAIVLAAPSRGHEPCTGL
jgi:hypothetical protein